MASATLEKRNGVRSTALTVCTNTNVASSLAAAAPACAAVSSTSGDPNSITTRLGRSVRACSRALTTLLLTPRCVALRARRANTTPSASHPDTTSTSLANVTRA
jgi:hypothetical protein